MQIKCEIILFCIDENYDILQDLKHPNSNSFSQVFFTTAKSLSIAVYVSINLDVFFFFFLLPLLQDVLPKINNHKSGDCWPFNNSIF